MITKNFFFPTQNQTENRQTLRWGSIWDPDFPLSAQERGPPIEMQRLSIHFQRVTIFVATFRVVTDVWEKDVWGPSLGVQVLALFSFSLQGKSQVKTFLGKRLEVPDILLPDVRDHLNIGGTPCSKKTRRQRWKAVSKPHKHFESEPGSVVTQSEIRPSGPGHANLTTP